MRQLNSFKGEFKSSFLSCEKDTETIIRKLFVDSRPYSDFLKRLLLINTKDCIDDTTNQAYIDKINNTSIADLVDQGYIRFNPKQVNAEHEEVKSYLIITFDNFFPNKTNPYYRDCDIMIDIVCHHDTWDLGNYRQRPLKIAGFIDGILNNSKLSGIGVLNFVGAKEIVSKTFSGYCLIYNAVHGVDDLLEPEEEE